MHSAQELVANVTTLATLPSVYLRIRDELDAPAGSTASVAHAISTDPAIASSLLRLANSAFYGYGGRIETISRAVTVLGIQQVHDLVLAISVSGTFTLFAPRHLDMPRFWRGSVMRGLAAREIGRSQGMIGVERLFVIGLLSDIGHLVMYQTIPELTREARVVAAGSGESLHLAERRIVGCDHAEVGAALMAHWRLPTSFVDIIGAQTTPRLGGDYVYEAAMVHVAARIAEADQENESSTAAAERIDPTIWALLEMEPANLRRIRESAELDLAGYTALFFPNLGNERAHA
ncbi:HDOD domain-containing protein [Aromatoleum petrolei]|uniref:HDOD domain-containing protein n=1 Tax=Aromatoleum petrolei TaxID=76116 RepID=A0ABX1MUL5_9RHOO|nr:HDOD domain-containing protein [Aromatoleum petrolei]NMF90376.1 HDOD domain-containing protein [Aromatoleum petrolei]QTQ37929.1 Metal-dependent hydrolase HDOD [Aromatoleum petrolei]